MKRFTVAVLVSVALVALAYCVVHAQRPEKTGTKPAPHHPVEPGSIRGFAKLPAGQFERGDHHGFVDPKHGSDELPVRTIHLDAFEIGVHTVTNMQYCAFLNSALADKSIEVREGGVYLSGGRELLCETRRMSAYSRIGWDGKTFAVLDKKEEHPMVCVRWAGAAIYSNWLSRQQQRPECYNTTTWECDFNKSGFRLPTEAEWEYAARGGQQKPYGNFPWGDEPDPRRANWPESKNPYRAGPQPWTTPVGFFSGKLHRQSDLGWPGTQETFQTADGANGYGLYDMAGNVWQWCNDWYERRYYAYCPDTNPPGPAEGSRMPDGKPYRVMRGGNWYNGEYGHSRVSNRDPSYFRGPQDPNHPFYHVGFRVVLPIDAEKRPAIQLTPVPPGGPDDRQPGGRPPRRPGERPLPREGERRGEGRPVEPPDGRGDQRPPRNDPTPQRPVKKDTGFILSSSEVKEGGALPKDYTGDGSAATLPLEWKGAPAETKSFALIMHHEAPDGIKWYWVLYNIPADVRRLPKNVADVGTLGNNSVNRRAGYAPPHSKGPGAKQYTYTLYALSAAPPLSMKSQDVSREMLLKAMEGLILDTAELNVTYTRDFGDSPPPRPGEGERRPPRGDRE